MSHGEIEKAEEKERKHHIHNKQKRIFMTIFSANLP